MPVIEVDLKVIDQILLLPKKKFPGQLTKESSNIAILIAFQKLPKPPTAEKEAGTRGCVETMRIWI